VHHSWLFWYLKETAFLITDDMIFLHYISTIRGQKTTSFRKRLSFGLHKFTFDEQRSPWWRSLQPHRMYVSCNYLPENRIDSPGPSCSFPKCFSYIMRSICSSTFPTLLKSLSTLFSVAIGLRVGRQRDGTLLNSLRSQGMLNPDNIRDATAAPEYE